MPSATPPATRPSPVEARPGSSTEGPRRIVIFVTIIQSILFLAHGLVYATWVSFWGPPAHGSWKLQVLAALLSVSFVSASLLAWRFSHVLVRLFYTAAAVWLGLLNFLVFASLLCWLLYGAAHFLELHIERRVLVGVCFGLAFLATLCGIVNAGWIRVTTVAVKLPNLPEAWRGRVAALVGDVHLGHIRGNRFIRRIVTMLGRLRPDIVFMTGDLYDGTAANYTRLAAPLAGVAAPFGVYFVLGNHEEFTDPAKFLNAVASAGVHILNNESVLVDGLQIAGVHDSAARDPERLRAILRAAGLERTRASILLNHAPQNLALAEEAGISLQLSGHTHHGQFLPWNWAASRVYGQFAYGLNRFGKLLVYTTSGAGTWGPPLRVGTRPEIVLLRFE